MAHEDLYDAIDKRRSQLQSELDQLRKTKNDANKRWNADIRSREEALSKLPRPPINRPKKQPVVTVEGMTKVLTALGESLKDDEGDGDVVTLPQLEITAEDRTERV